MRALKAEGVPVKDDKEISRESKREQLTNSLMKIVNKYSYPKSSRAKLDGLRHYTIDGSQKKLPSVTTVLGQTQPKEKQEKSGTLA